MQINRVLVIICERSILQFLLLSQGHDGTSLIGAKRIRINSHTIDFSITEYILQALTIWGGTLGVTFVKEMVLLVPQVDNEGVGEIIIFTDIDYADLSTLTKNVYVKSDDIEQEGASLIAESYNFERLLYVGLEQDFSDIVSFCKNKKDTVRVVSESDKFSVKEILEHDELRKITDQYAVLSDYNTISNYLMNESFIPVFSVTDIRNVLLEFLLAFFRFKKIVNKKKLSLAGFGGGEIDKHILIIGGEAMRIFDNYPLHILSILSVLNLSGTFSIFIDKFGIYDALQKMMKFQSNINSFSDILLDFWGYGIVANTKKSHSLHKLIGEVRFIEDTNERVEKLFSDGILKHTIDEETNVTVELASNYFIKGNNTNLDITIGESNVLIDTRDRNVYSFLQSQDNRDELLLRWFKNIGVIP